MTICFDWFIDDVNKLLSDRRVTAKACVYLQWSVCEKYSLTHTYHAEVITKHYVRLSVRNHQSSVCSSH